MKKLLALCVGLGLFSQQALAITTVQGNTFAGYVDTLVDSSSGVLVETNNSVTSPAGVTTSVPGYDYNTSAVENDITDLDEGSAVMGSTFGGGDYVDLAFNTGVINGAGDIDLSIFFVGSAGHTVDLTIGTQTERYSLAPGEGATGDNDTLFGTYPIIRLDVNLDDFTSLTGAFTDFRLTIGDRWCDKDLDNNPTGASRGDCSSVPSFVGANAVVPVPAAVWLFGSGLLWLVGVARRRK